MAADACKAEGLRHDSSCQDLHGHVHLQGSKVMIVAAHASEGSCGAEGSLDAVVCVAATCEAEHVSWLAYMTWICAGWNRFTAVAPLLQACPRCNVADSQPPDWHRGWHTSLGGHAASSKSVGFTERDQSGSICSHHSQALSLLEADDGQEQADACRCELLVSVSYSWTRQYRQSTMHGASPTEAAGKAGSADAISHAVAEEPVCSTPRPSYEQRQHLSLIRCCLPCL